MKKIVQRDSVKITFIYEAEGDQVTVTKAKFEIDVNEVYSRAEFEDELGDDAIERLLEEIE